MKLFCLLAPLGAALGLVFSAKTCSQLLEIFVITVEREKTLQFDPARWHIMGVMGWILFGVGVVATVITGSSRGKGSAVACAAAAVMIFVAAILMGWGGIAGRQHFNILGTGGGAPNPVDIRSQMDFLQWVFTAAFSLMLAGGIFITIATLASQTEEKSRPSWIAMVAILLSLPLIAISGLWSLSSVAELKQEIVQAAGATPDPNILANGIQSNYLSMITLSLGVFGCAVALGATAIHKLPSRIED